jgi:hypothetical protein
MAKTKPAATAPADTAEGGEQAQAPLPPAVNWSAVKRRYRNKRKTTVKDIAAHFGIQPKELREIARERGWRRPSRRHPKPKAPTTLPERILEVVDGQLTQLELQLEKDLMPNSPEAARRLRDMHQVVRNYDPSKAGDDPAKRAPGANPTSGESDAERWRHELVERIKKLKAKFQAS